MGVDSITDVIRAILEWILDAICYLLGAFLFVISAVIVGAIIYVAGTIVNVYSFTFAYVVFVLFLPIVRWSYDVDEFLKQDIGFIIGVRIVSGAFFYNYLLTTAAIVGMGLTFLRQ